MVLGMANRYKVLTTEVELPSVAAPGVLEAAVAYRRMNTDPRWSGPKGDFPRLVLRGTEYRLVLGGITFKVPATPPIRAMALFKDPQAARSIGQLEIAYIRRNAYLMFLEGQWYLRLRFQSKEGLIEGRDDAGRVTWKAPKRRRRRWAVAPADAPRDKYGNLLSDVTIARRRKRNAPGDTP